MSLQSPLARVLGAGSAKEGTDHWWLQRLSSVALLILGAWFLIALQSLDSFSLSAVLSWAAQPWSSVMLLLLGLTLSYHSAQGLQVVIEDYVHGPMLKVVALIANKFAHGGIAAASTFAVLKIAFGSA